MSQTSNGIFWAAQAWLTQADGSQGWHENVRLKTDGAGNWCEISAGISAHDARLAGAEIIKGALLPGLVNAHSHAFQRAFAGLAEQRNGQDDDFWSWRDRMYRVALAISPEEFKAIATQLYIELLRGGYTHVCEFHYVHHAPDGSPYADPFTMTWALTEAAHDAGIGLTLLPVVYERAGMDQEALRTDQRRFAADAQWAMRCAEAVNTRTNVKLNAGVALHSIRAATPQSIRAVAAQCQHPIHIHISEQTAEVDACVAATGARPVRWLTDTVALDTRWNLVHATHVDAEEIALVARAGASVVICPTTEANLGDGITRIPHWFAEKVPLSIGSDSHVCRDAFEELRLMEYGQRLMLRKRNVLANAQTGLASTAARLFSESVAAGARACGAAQTGLRVGARADALVLDTTAPNLLGIAMENWLDVRTFSSPSTPFENVMVAGQWMIRNGQHAYDTRSKSAFIAAMNALTNHGS